MRSIVRSLPGALALCALFAHPALAGKADVIDVKVYKDGPGSYAFTVTVKSDDKGWQKYADKWEVVAPDGTVLGTRVLLHPHDTEQPFTRDLGGVKVPAGITSVRIRAHDKVEGWGGKEMTIEVPK
jgi:hypothetical protein